MLQKQVPLQPLDELPEEAALRKLQDQKERLEHAAALKQRREKALVDAAALRMKIKDMGAEPVA